MQFQTLLLLSGSLFAAFTTASDCEALIAQVPSCSKACMTPILFEKVGCKDEHDLKCLCAKQGDVRQFAAGCVLKHCGGQTIDVVKKSQEVCGCVGA